MLDNQQIYATRELGRWVGAQGLNSAETFLIKRFLDQKSRILEAGTGGGRVLFSLQSDGFEDLHGFDYVPEMIAAARRCDSSGRIDFQVQDATSLNYPDASFDGILYLQQLPSLIGSEQGRRDAVHEAFRVLRPGGRAIFTFLSHRTRGQSAHYRLLMSYLKCLRWLRGSQVSTQYLPWLRVGGKTNWRALLDLGPYIFWFTERDADELATSAGFRVIAAGSQTQIDRGELCDSVAGLQQQPVSGLLCLVCDKPVSP